jgi:hypothetical protein
MMMMMMMMMMISWSIDWDILLFDKMTEVVRWTFAVIPANLDLQTRCTFRINMWQLQAY